MKYLGSITDDKDIVNKKYVDNKIPTKVSELTNDKGFITLADLPIYNGGVS